MSPCLKGVQQLELGSCRNPLGEAQESPMGPQRAGNHSMGTPTGMAPINRAWGHSPGSPRPDPGTPCRYQTSCWTSATALQSTMLTPSSIQGPDCSPSRANGLFSFPWKVEEHGSSKKPSEVPCYINSPVGSMTKVLLCCWTIEWIIYSYPPRLAIKQLTTLKITKKKEGGGEGGTFYKNSLFKHGLKKNNKFLFSKRGKYIILFTAEGFKATIQDWNFSQFTHVRYLHFGGSYIV